MRISAKRGKHLVLWDGDCGFCRRCVAWLDRQDLFGVLEFRPYQEAEISASLREACAKAVHVVTKNGVIFKGAKAVLFCGRFTRFHRLARLLEWPIFLPVLEIGYGIVARNRVFFSRLLYFI